MEGMLRPGDTLPPVRRLAIDLGIHFNIVAEAYRALAEEGLLEIVHGHGARVIDRGAFARPQSEMSRRGIARPRRGLGRPMILLLDVLNRGQALHRSFRA